MWNIVRENAKQFAWQVQNRTSGSTDPIVEDEKKVLERLNSLHVRGYYMQRSDCKEPKTRSFVENKSYHELVQKFHSF